MATNNTSYDYALSIMVAERIGAEPLRCWRNAALAVFLLPNLFAAGSYIEGWIVLQKKKTIAIIEHGWATLPDQSVVDPTIIFTEKQNQPLVYFPGYVLSREQLCRLLPGSTLPLICHSSYGKNGMKHHGYQAAYTQARQQARALARKKQLPHTAIQVCKRDSRRGLTLVIG